MQVTSSGFGGGGGGVCVCIYMQIYGEVEDTDLRVVCGTAYQSGSWDARGRAGKNLLH